MEEGRGEQEGAGSEVEGGHQNGYTDAVSAERGDASLDADEDADGGALRGLSVHTDVAGSGEGVDASPPKQRTDPVDDDSSVATTPGHTEPRQAPEDIVPEKSPESGTPRERDGESRSMRSLKAFTKSAPPRGDGLSTEDVQMALFHVEQLFSSSAQELVKSSSPCLAPCPALPSHLCSPRAQTRPPTPTPDTPHRAARTPRPTVQGMGQPRRRALPPDPSAR